MGFDSVLYFINTIFHIFHYFEYVKRYRYIPSADIVFPFQVNWVKETTPTNNPLLISTNEDIQSNHVVEGHNKYDIRRTVNNNREQYQLIIRALTENDAGKYKCQIRLSNLNYQQWPRKSGLLTVQSKLQVFIHIPHVHHNYPNF